MKRDRIESDTLVSLGYSKINKVLELEYKNGSVYQYYDIAADSVEVLKHSRDHARYIREEIVPNYEYEKI